MSLIRFFDNDFEKAFFDRWDRALAKANQDQPSTAVNGFWPAVDISDHDKEICIHADLPGLKKEEIKIEVHENTLSISGETSHEKKIDEKNYKVRERSYGSFQRTIALPKNVDTNAIKANFENGVLEVKVQKVVPTAQAKKTISIS